MTILKRLTIFLVMIQIVRGFALSPRSTLLQRQSTYPLSSALHALSSPQKDNKSLGRNARNADGSKRRHYRREGEQDEPWFAPDAATRGGRRSSEGMSGQIQQRRGFHDGSNNNRFNSNDMSSTSADPWKVLVKKLDSTKNDGDKARFGKVTSEFTSNKNNDNVPDEMQCVHFDQCAGCNLRGNFAEAPIVTRAKIFFKTEGVDMAVHLGKHHGYRTHVKLAVGPQSRWGGLNVGLYREGSHQIEAIPDCRVHHPAINECVEFIKEAAKEVGVRGYQPADRRQKRADRGRGVDRVKVVGSGTGKAEGELRYIQLSLEEHTGKVQVTLVWNCADFKGAGQNLPRLVKRLRQRPELVHSVTANFQAAETNTIFNFKPRAWKLLWGPPVLKQQVGDATFFFKPQIFRQANLGVFADGIIPQVVLNIPPGAAVAELYSGIGIMGLNAANKASEVLCSDSNEYVTGVFDSCVTSLPNKEDHEKVFYEALSAEEAIVEGQCDDADVVLVDPPRKGLDTGVMEMLIGTHSEVKTPASLKRLIYVSCGFEALERDTRELLASNKWRLQSADGYVIFPGSNHIETVAVFDYVGGQEQGERGGRRRGEKGEEEGEELQRQQQQRSWENRPSQRR